ncbi:MAG: translation initiation factor IF-3 [Erysipelotrichaceae bacterium]|nr:translation initiation factor IF-3 [Erysipelotrichaceae bacterium]MBQ1300075.1 translation initiation factor IF-3 [Erysipelotrichaceae bacterium]MBQ1304144.1 translation initiation factor IF-3 [Erysipelotrichaceae bacterium]MBQ1757812.1 translation initiation factor IF-3 [Erysipelotrichaceae bacterium]MBQ2685290.1 translation initiation factor IF-3 [Erysipelotrichaceae bacterium]
MAKKNQNDDLVNESIRFKEVLVIDLNGNSLGILLRREALDRAYDQDKDLVCVAPQAVPPVCKIMDYGKYRFEQQKKAKEAKRNQKTTEIKPLRLSPVIDTHDFETKVKQSRKWLEEGNKVRVDMRFRGRMMTRQDVGKKVMESFIAELSDVGNVDKQPVMEGNTMSCVISPVKK